MQKSLNDMDNRRFQKVAKSLEDPRRFEIFRKIAAAGAEGMRCGAVREGFPVSRATVSRHLSKAPESGPLESRGKAQFKNWPADDEITNEYIAELQNRPRPPTAKSLE